MKTHNTLPFGIGAFAVVLSLFVVTDCGEPVSGVSASAQDVPPGAEGIELKNAVELDQGVTTQIQPQDEIFIDFEKNWRNFISDRKELDLRVVDVGVETPWSPLVFSDCVFSEGAGAYVPQMTIIWAEPRAVSERQPVRFDLTTHYQGFERESYTTVFPVAEQQRFRLPPNSSLIQNTEAVLLTGPAMFPKLVDFSQVQVSAGPSPSAQGSTAQPSQGAPQAQLSSGFEYTVKLQDLAPGLAYKFRKATLSGSAWRSNQITTFSTPVCAQKF